MVAKAVDLINLVATSNKRRSIYYILTNKQSYTGKVNNIKNNLQIYYDRPVWVELKPEKYYNCVYREMTIYQDSVARLRLCVFTLTLSSFSFRRWAVTGAGTCLNPFFTTCLSAVTE